MNPIEIENQIAAKINEIETCLARAGQLMAEANGLATVEFETFYSADAVAKANTKVKPAGMALDRAKARFATLHAALLKAYNTASFPRPRTGK